MGTTPAPPILSSAENWGLCDPHELFLERAARVEPGGARAFIEMQIEAFGNRACALEQEARRWSCEVAPLPKGKKGRGERGALAGFVAERASAYRAYAQALESALELLASPGEGKTRSSPGRKEARGGRGG